MSEQNRWPVVVIGGGPAGAMAAHGLAKRGIEVLLVDKARFPRSKVCGSCLGGLALRTLDQAQLGHLPMQLGGRVLNRIRLVSGGRTVNTAADHRVAVGRTAFDNALLDEAATAGATVWQQATATAGPCDSNSRRVTVRKNDVRIELNAHVVVMASGLASNLPGDADIQYRTRPAPRLGFGGVTSLSETSNAWPRGELTMAVGPRGYAGVVRTESNQLDIAAALDRSVFKQADGPRAEIARLLHAIDPTIDQWLGDVSFQGSPPLTSHASQVAAERLILIGDAAGYVEPFTGEGIGWALAGGAIASKLTAEAIAMGQLAALPGGWRRAHATAIARQQRACKLVSQSLRYAVVRQIAMTALTLSPRFATPVLRAIEGASNIDKRRGELPQTSPQTRLCGEAPGRK